MGSGYSKNGCSARGGEKDGREYPVDDGSRECVPSPTGGCLRSGATHARQSAKQGRIEDQLGAGGENRNGRGRQGSNRRSAGESERRLCPVLRSGSGLRSARISV